MRAEIISQHKQMEQRHDVGGLHHYILCVLVGLWDLSLVPVGGFEPGPQASVSGDVGLSPAYLGISPMQSLSTWFTPGFIKVLSLWPFQAFRVPLYGVNQ